MPAVHQLTLGLSFPPFLAEFQELLLQTRPTVLFYFHDQKTPTCIPPVENKEEKDEHFSRLVLSVTSTRRQGKKRESWNGPTVTRNHHMCLQFSR